MKMTVMQLFHATDEITLGWELRFGMNKNSLSFWIHHMLPTDSNIFCHIDASEQRLSCEIEKWCYIY